jgi:hypothetical protein
MQEALGSILNTALKKKKKREIKNIKYPSKNWQV